MSSCTNNINASNYTDTDTLDDISRGTEKVTIADNVDVSRYDDMSGMRLKEMNNKKCTSCEQNLEHAKTNKIGADNASGNADKVVKAVDIVSNMEEVQTCANCGKAGASNTCNKCKQVKYCNAACKKRHRHKHKADCEEHLKRAAQIQQEENKRAAKLHDIELFKQQPQQERDCPICFLLLPILSTGSRYNACCGKDICSGCIHAMDNKLCPFCRTPTPNIDEAVTRLQKRVDAGDAQAINNLGIHYALGSHGFPQDYAQALELWKRSAELGYAYAYQNIGTTYGNGNGVGRDMKKAEHYYELGAMRGDAQARHMLGHVELKRSEPKRGNIDRALRHYMIALEGGYNDSLKDLQKLYSNGLATKDEYTEALRAYQKYLKEVKSSQRDEAAAYSDLYKYIE